MKECKFCKAAEGVPGPRGKSIHINRDGLCGPCYTLITKMSLQPEKVHADERRWCGEICRYNALHGGYVPRQNMKGPKVWTCSKCGDTDEDNKDHNYTSMCHACAKATRGRGNANRKKM